MTKVKARVKPARAKPVVVTRAMVKFVALRQWITKRWGAGGGCGIASEARRVAEVGLKHRLSVREAWVLVDPIYVVQFAERLGLRTNALTVMDAKATAIRELLRQQGVALNPTLRAALITELARTGYPILTDLTIKVDERQLVGTWQKVPPARVRKAARR